MPGGWIEGKHGKGTPVVLKSNGRRGVVVECRPRDIRIWFDDDASESEWNTSAVHVYSEAWSAFAKQRPYQQYENTATVFPNEPPVLVAAKPAMLAIESCAAAECGLLPTLLKHTEGEQHSEVFSTEAVSRLIDFKWQTCVLSVLLVFTS